MIAFAPFCQPSCVRIVLALERPIGRIGKSKLDHMPILPFELCRKPHVDPALGRIAIIVDLKIKNRVELMNAAKTRGS